jgi:hypothetical protein
MHTETGQTGAYPPSELSSFVIDNIASYEVLHAPTLEAGNNQFRVALAQAVQANRPGEVIGEGFFNTVHTLEGDERVVIKRLARSVYAEGDTKRAQIWQEIQTDHRMVLSYFGRRFIPDTEFLAVDLGLDPNASAPRREYIAVQERAVGQQLHTFRRGTHVSPALKETMIGFIVRCERMMRDGIALDHPDDLMINDSPGAVRRVTLLDTNNLAQFADVKNGRNATIFLEEHGIDPDSLQTPEDVVTMIRSMTQSILGLTVREATVLHKQRYATLMTRLQEGTGDLEHSLRKALRRVPSNLERVPPRLRDSLFLDQMLFSGFRAFISLADRFAPEGQHPQAIANMMKTFGIRNTDLP